MNSSSEIDSEGRGASALRGAEPAPTAPAAEDCVPMQYRDVCETAESRAAETAPAGPPVEPEAEPAGPNIEELLAARAEQERRAVTVELRQQFDGELAAVRQAMAAALEEFARQRDEYFRQVEGEVVQLALAIARHILHRESQIDPRLLAGLVNHELLQMEASTAVRLFVAPEAMVAWREQSAGLSHAVELVADKSLGAAELRMESSLGSTVISFEAELKEIERGFFDLLAHRPPLANENKTARVQ